MLQIFRALVRRPGFSLVAALTLALGIGANTALFSVVNAVLLRSWGFAQPERLVQITGKNKKGQDTGVSIPDLQAIAGRAHSLERVGTSRITTFTLLGAHEPENLYGHMVSPECFAALGATPLLGRIFAPNDYESGAPPVVVLSHSLWQSSFESDPRVIGRRVLMNGQEHSIIGVMRPEFQFQHPVFRVWTPWKFNSEDLANRQIHGYTLIARLKAGATQESAAAELEGLSQGLAREFPDTNTGWKSVVQPLTEPLLRNLRPVLMALMGAVGFVLLIACMNVSNLVMARGLERSRELAVRAAMGARPLRLARELLTESLIIAVVGGALGLLFARWCLHVLLAALPASTFPVLPRADQATIDARVLWLSVGACLLTGLLFGLAPAVRLSRPNLEEALREGSRSNTGGLGKRRWLSALIVAETALSVVLLVGAGLMIRSFVNTVNIAPGFRPERVLTAQIPSEWRNISRRNDPNETRRVMDYFHDIVERLRKLPGVDAAGLVTVLPLGHVNINTIIFLKGRPAPGPGEDQRVAYRAVSPDYFRVMGIPVLRGRTFTDEDRVDHPQVAIVSDSLARQYWPNVDAVGKYISLSPSPNGPWIQIVGVVGGVRFGRLRDEPDPELYTSYVQTLLAAQVTTVVLRTRDDPLSLAPAVRETIHAVNPKQPIADLRTMTDVVEEAVAQPRLYATLLSILAALALLLAAAGIFSVISWTVNRSTHEIGIRMALGAAPGSVLRSILLRVLLESLGGAAVGLGAAAALTHILKAQLYGVTPTDPATFAIVTVFLGGCALLAAYLPARRATRVDPMSALRAE